MKDLILVITAMCILGGTLMANTPAENIQDDESPQERELKASVRAWKAKEKAKAAAKEKERKEQIEKERIFTEARASLCLSESVFDPDHVVIPSSFDFICLLALALEDMGITRENAPELAEELLLILPDVYHTDQDSLYDDSVSFFGLNAAEQREILKGVGIFDTAIQELISYIPATLDGTCPLDTECPEDWLNFFEYLFAKTKNPFWKDMHGYTNTWFTREARAEWVDAVGMSASVVFYSKDIVESIGGRAVAGWDKVVGDTHKFWNQPENYRMMLYGCMSIVLLAYLPTLFFYVKPEIFLISTLGVKIATLGIGMILSTVFDHLITKAAVFEKTINEAFFFHQYVTPLVSLLIAYRAYKWFPGEADKKYSAAALLALELIRQYTIYKTLPKEEVGHGVVYRTISFFDIMWGVVVLREGMQQLELERIQRGVQRDQVAWLEFLRFIFLIQAQVQAQAANPEAAVQPPPN